MLVPIWQPGMQDCSWCKSSIHTSNLSHQQTCTILLDTYGWKSQICTRNSQSCLRIPSLLPYFPWTSNAECRFLVLGEAGQVWVTPTSLGFSAVEGSISLGCAFPSGHASGPDVLPLGSEWHLLSVGRCTGLLELCYMLNMMVVLP